MFGREKRESRGFNLGEPSSEDAPHCGSKNVRVRAEKTRKHACSRLQYCLGKQIDPGPLRRGQELNGVRLWLGPLKERVVRPVVYKVECGSLIGRSLENREGGDRDGFASRWSDHLWKLNLPSAVIDDIIAETRGCAIFTARIFFGDEGLSATAHPSGNNDIFCVPHFFPFSSPHMSAFCIR